MSEYVTAKTHATCTLSAFRNAGVTSVGIIPERHKHVVRDWGPEAWEASAEARRGRAKALKRLARAEAWARRYNKKHPGPRPGDRPNAAALGYSYSSENFGIDTDDARRKPLTPREAAELPWRGEQRVRVPISRPPWLQETENRPIEEVPSYEEVDVENAGDSDVCEACLDISEAGPYELDEAEDLIPAHPWCRCICPGTKIEGEILVGSKAFYSGPIVELITASGKGLRLTINHPVMTQAGLMPAGALRKGDKLFSEGNWIGIASTNDKDNGPSLVEDIFEALARVAIIEVNSAAMDLHGEAENIEGNVQLVASDPRLLCDIAETLSHSISDASLKIADETFGRAVSIGSLPVTGEWPHPRPLEALLFGRHADFNAVAFQQANYSPAIYAIFPRQPQDRNTAFVSSRDSFLDFADLPSDLASDRSASGLLSSFRSLGDGDITSLHALGHAPERDASGTKLLRDTTRPNANLARDHCTAQTLLNVHFDDLLDIKRSWFSGHVYDLQSTTGYLIADGIAIGNCAFVPAGKGSVHDAGDLPGHPFRGNQWTTGEGGGEQTTTRDPHSGIEHVQLGERSYPVRDTASGIDDNDVRGAAVVEKDGSLSMLHVTDNPERMTEALKGDHDLTDMGDEYDDLGKGFYGSGQPQIWMSRSTGKWAFLNEMNPQQTKAYVGAIRQEIEKQHADHYISHNEYERAIRDLGYVEEGKLTPEASLFTAEQPYNIRSWEPEFLNKVGIQPPKQPSVAKINFGGRFVDLTSGGFSPEHVEQARKMGFDGAYVRNGFSTTAQFVLWKRTAIAGVKLLGQHQIDAKTFGALLSQTTYVEDIEAAGVLFHTPTGHMLLMKRADTGQWSIPAGGLEENEDPLRAAQRESAEETGNPGDHKARKVDERTTNGVHFHTFAQPAEWQFAPILNPEHTKYGWFQKHDLPEPLHPGLAATMHAMSEGGVTPFADSEGSGR